MPGVGTCTTGSSARRTARTARNIVTTASVLCAAKRENGRSIVRRSRSDLFGHTQATRHASSATRIVMPGSVVGFREEKCISSFGTRSMQFLLANYIQRELRRDPESSGACYASAVGVSLQGIRLMHRPEKADRLSLPRQRVSLPWGEELATIPSNACRRGLSLWISRERRRHCGRPKLLNRDRPGQPVDSNRRVPSCGPQECAEGTAIFE